jgi:dihydrofolate reductase
MSSYKNIFSNKNIEYNMIVAHDSYYGIGNEGRIPWYISEDLIYFRDITLNHIVVMGRKTYDSIPSTRKPLKDRINIVLTNNYENYQSSDNLIYCNESKLEYYIDYFNKMNNINKVFFIGGRAIYKKYMNIVDNLYITNVCKDYKCDVFFPEYENNFYIFKIVKTLYSSNEDCNVVFRHYKPK